MSSFYSVDDRFRRARDVALIRVSTYINHHQFAMFTRPMLKRKKEEEEEEESALFWPPRKKNGVIPDSEKMHERRWENLGMDCITMVFARVGMESLILSLPFVCKSWYAATLDPL